MAGGVWTTAAPTVRPGVYFNFVAAASAAVAPGPSGVVAVMGTSNWGPENVPTVIESPGQFDATFSTDEVTTLRAAVRGAFQGLNLGGATQVIAYRLCGKAASTKKAEVEIKGASTSKLKLVAKYAGERGNKLKISVAVSGNITTLKILEEAVVLETLVVEHSGGVTMTELGAALEAFAKTSKYLATGTITVTLGSEKTAAQTATAMTGGENGTTLVVAEDVKAACEAFRLLVFTAMVFANVSDFENAKLEKQKSPTQEELVAFIKEYNQTSGMRAFLVVGGETEEAFVAAKARANKQPASEGGNWNNPDIINLGRTDLKRLTDGTILNTSQMAPFVAGAICQMGLRRSLTGIQLTGYQVNPKVSPSATEYTEAITTGVCMFENVNAETVMIASGVTSLVSIAGSPYATYGTETLLHQNVRNVAIDHTIQNTLNTANVGEIGALLATQTGRNDFVASVLAFLKGLEKQNVLQPGSTVEVDTRYVSTGGALFLRVGIGYVEAYERFFFTVTV